MMFLSAGNKIIQDTMQQKMAEGAKLEPLDIRLADFDGCLFRIFVDANALETMYVSISMSVVAELKMYGGQVLLDETYAGMVVEPAQEGFDLTLGFSVTDPPGGKEACIKKVSEFKRNLVGAPFDQCFAALAAGQAASLPPIMIHIRPLETIFVVPQQDRIVIIFAVDFKDITDQAFAKVFLQEFVDAGRQYLPVGFSRDPPMELQGVNDLPTQDSLVGFVSFAIEARHVTAGAKREKAVTMIQGFRSYLHYHIKATKSHLHTRMRSRVVALLQVLNRAVPEKGLTEKKAKTASGKTFTRS